jgi:hypothetical protein
MSLAATLRCGYGTVAGAAFTSLRDMSLAATLRCDYGTAAGAGFTSLRDMSLAATALSASRCGRNRRLACRRDEPPL